MGGCHLHAWPSIWSSLLNSFSSFFLSFPSDLCIYQVCGNFAEDARLHQIEAKIGFRVIEQVDLSIAQYVLAFERYPPFLIKYFWKVRTLLDQILKRTRPSWSNFERYALFLIKFWNVRALLDLILKGTRPSWSNTFERYVPFLIKFWNVRALLDQILKGTRPSWSIFERYAPF